MKATNTQGTAWQMTSKEWNEVKRSGKILGKTVDVNNLVAVEIQVGFWSVWMKLR